MGQSETLLLLNTSTRLCFAARNMLSTSESGIRVLTLPETSLLLTQNGQSVHAMLELPKLKIDYTSTDPNDQVSALDDGFSLVHFSSYLSSSY